MSAEARQTSFGAMIELALETGMVVVRRYVKEKVKHWCGVWGIFVPGDPPALEFGEVAATH